jgi:hypothetical protein
MSDATPRCDVDEAPAPSADRVRELLVREVVATSNAVLASGGRVDADRIAAIEHLARLVELQNSVMPPLARRRWPVVAAFLLTLVIATVLLYGEVPETDVELGLRATEIAFAVQGQQKFGVGIRLSSVGVGGLGEAEIPQSARSGVLFLKPSGFDGNLRLLLVPDPSQGGSLDLEPFILPAGTRVWLRHTGVPYEARLSFSGPPLVLRASVRGPLTLSQPGAEARRLEFVAPKAIVLRGSALPLDVDLRFLELVGTSLLSDIEVSGVSLVRTDEVSESGRTVVRRRSTVMDGTLHFESLNGRERRLRPGEVLEFRHAEGEVRTLQVERNHLSIQFHGRVAGMETGSDRNRRSLMPSYLEWLYARRGLELLWATALYLFGLSAGVLGWLGRSR